MDTVYDDGGNRRPKVQIPTVRDSETDRCPGSRPRGGGVHICVLFLDGTGAWWWGGGWKEQKPKKKNRNR